MSFSINTNLAALNAHRNLSRIDEQRNTTLERLSTGLRINKAADDASGLSIANGFQAQSLGIGQAISNATDATSLTQIADGALQESTNILNTIRTKSVQAASDGQTTETRQLIQNDINRLLTQLDNIAQTTSFNGQKLLSGAFSNKSFQVGANANQTVAVSIGSAESTHIGHVSTVDLALSSPEGGDVQLTLTSGITGAKLTVNTVSIQANNQAENGLGALTNEINRYSSTTGIQAAAVVQTTGVSSISSGTTGADFAINGVTVGAINVQNSDANGALVNGINVKSNETGVTASTTNDGKLVLTSRDGRAIKVTGSLGDVAGGTATQFTSFGHIHLTQSGVNDFQIGGSGAAATGTDFTINGNTNAVQDSVLAAGSTIKGDSTLVQGSLIGGDVTVNADVNTAQDSLVKSGSTLAAGSILAAGAQITGSVAVNGNTALTQDAVLAKGTTLTAGTVLAAGTLVTTAFTGNTESYQVGQTLNTAVTLQAGEDFTLTADLTLTGAVATGSTLGDTSILASGSVLGADITLGAATTLSGDLQVKTGSTLAADSVLKAGSTLGEDTVQKTGTDITTTQTTKLKAGSILADQSVLAQGSTLGATATVTSGATTLTSDQTLKANSILKQDSILKAGTLLAQDIEGVKAGTVLGADLKLITGDVTLTTDFTLKAGSTIEDGSTLALNTTNAPAVALENKHNSRLSDVNVLTADGAQTAISIVDSALKDVNATRASLGAVQNQLSSTIANLSVTQTNVNAAESAIRDVDFASEAGNFSRIQVLSQAGSFALSQANAASQSVLSLLQR